MRVSQYILTSAILCTLLVSACSLAPDFKRPAMDIPKNYKEEQGKWLPVDAKASVINQDSWWKAYHDPELDTLEAKIAVSNQNLKAAVARYDEARAIASQTRAGYFPTVTAMGIPQREKTSKTVADASPNTQFNDFLGGLDLTYEIDIWGKVRNAVKADEAQAKATAADLAVMELSLHAELAMDYFSLRGDDEAQIVLNKTVDAYDRAFKLIEARHAGGIAAETDVDLANTQLQNAKTQAADMQLKRSQLEHAIAVLVGEMPAGFTIEAKATTTPVPPVTPDIPSTLLEQRPDIAAASLRVESANALIGVARAAYYPDFTFNADVGLESAIFSKLFTAPSLFWAFGPTITTPLFDGGKIRGLNDQAKALYNESVANYRQTVLNAFQEVEDNLVALHQLALENTSQTAASVAAQRSFVQATDLYKGGVATPYDVVVAENAALQSQLLAVDVKTRQLNASVMLIKALGGGWHEDSKKP